MKKCIFYLPRHVEKNVLDNLSNTWKKKFSFKRKKTFDINVLSIFAHIWRDFDKITKNKTSKEKQKLKMVKQSLRHIFTSMFLLLLWNFRNTNIFCWIMKYFRNPTRKISWDWLLLASMLKERCKYDS